MLICILSWWFLLSISLSLLSQDIVLAEHYNIEGNVTYLIDVDTDNVNVTGEYESAYSAIGVLDMVVRMFTFRIPTSIVPATINVFISFLNLALLIMLGVVVYRLAIPTSGE